MEMDRLIIGNVARIDRLTMDQLTIEEYQFVYRAPITICTPVARKNKQASQKKPH